MIQMKRRRNVTVEGGVASTSDRCGGIAALIAQGSFSTG